MHLAISSGWHAAQSIIAALDGDCSRILEYQKLMESFRVLYCNAYFASYEPVAVRHNSEFWKRRLPLGRIGGSIRA